MLHAKACDGLILIWLVGNISPRGHGPWGVCTYCIVGVCNRWELLVRC